MHAKFYFERPSGDEKHSLDNNDLCRIKSTTQMLKRPKTARSPRSVENEKERKGRSTIHNSDSS